MQRGYARKRGFTLIELMIVVAVIAVLGAIALPSYQDYVRKGRRADGRALLQAASLAQEKHRLGNVTFANLATLCPALAPCNSEQANYSLAVTVTSPTAYTLTANATSSSQLGDTGCTAITLTVAGGGVTYGPLNKCWGK